MKSPKRSIAKRSVFVSGRQTSVSVEDQFWEALTEIATALGVSQSELITSINATRRHANLSSAVRLFVLKRYQSQIAAPKPTA